MCRAIRPLFPFEPPATEEEIRASALQFVRKVSGFSRPSQANAEAFARAVDEVADATRRLVSALTTAAPAARPGGRGDEGARAVAPAVRLICRRPPDVNEEVANLSFPLRKNALGRAS